MKLVARARKSPEPHSLEAVVRLQVREAHLNTLSFVSRFSKRLCLHLPPCDIAGASWRSRGILRASAVVQHFARIGHTSQSRFEANAIPTCARANGISPVLARRASTTV